MKKYILLAILVLSIVLGSFLVLSDYIKHRLPRSGEVKTAGGVSTPFLTPSSPFYFLKRWSEAAELFLSFNNPAKITDTHIILANKRLLELEVLSRSPSSSLDRNLLSNFAKEEKLAIRNIAKLATKDMLDSQLVLRLIQSYGNQREILTILRQRYPRLRGEIDDVEKSVAVELNNLFDELQSLGQIRELQIQAENRFQ